MKMKYFSCFISCLVQQSAVRADESPETLETARQHCEDWFVNQGEELENIFFDYVASGASGDVYRCESLRFVSMKVLLKNFNSHSSPDS